MNSWGGRKARFWPSLGLLFAPVLIIMGLRWVFFEPYVIPSSSMVPTLLENDFILVSKSYYGVRIPFSKTWLVKWRPVKRGDVVVFKYPNRPDTFFIKRAVAIAGDRISVSNGRLTINGEELDQVSKEIMVPNSILEVADYDGFTETSAKKQYSVIYSNVYTVAREYAEAVVPPNHFFVMGDNRDNSHDSRVWGFVPETHLMGRASFIWLSCENDTGLNFFNCESNPFRVSRMWSQIR